MIKRAPSLTIAFVCLGAFALVTAGPAIAHRIISKHQLQPTHHVAVNPATDDDYVRLLIQTTQPDW